MPNVGGYERHRHCKEPERAYFNQHTHQCISTRTEDADHGKIRNVSDYHPYRVYNNDILSGGQGVLRDVAAKIEDRNQRTSQRDYNGAYYCRHKRHKYHKTLGVAYAFLYLTRAYGFAHHYTAGTAKTDKEAEREIFKGFDYGDGGIFLMPYICEDYIVCNRSHSPHRLIDYNGSCLFEKFTNPVHHTEGLELDFVVLVQAVEAESNKASVTEAWGETVAGMLE
jgi:hypothetical protein